MSEVTPIHLSIPAEPAYARTVRMMAANLAVLLGMSVDTVEDVRMAAEEGFVWCCATKPDTCEIDFSLDGGLSMSLALGNEEPMSGDQALIFANLVLSTVCDEYELNYEQATLYLKKNADLANA